MINLRLCFLLLCLLASLGAQASSLELSEMDEMNALMQDCLNENRSHFYDKKRLVDCRKRLAPLQTTMADSKFFWSAAQITRREIGEVESLEFFANALDAEKTEERCVDHLLASATYRVLGYSSNRFPIEVNAAKNVVFVHCWLELKEEVIAETEAGKSVDWMLNVCPLLKTKGSTARGC